jgi:RNA polymerase sigma-70 factor (ECF subfamily)
VDVAGGASDAELLRAHLAGDRWAFGELAARHRSVMWWIARDLLDSAEDAEDAVQDSLLRAYRHAAGYRAEASVRTWLVRIVRNACLDRRRRRRVRPVTVGGLELADRFPTPDDPIAATDTRMDLAAALRRLPFEQREVVVLVDRQGFGIGEVARLLGVPDGTVKSRVARGRLRLRALLDPPRSPTTPVLTAPEQR